MKIALINPPPLQIKESWDAPNHPHPGLGYLAAYLKAKGNYDIAVMDAKLERLTLPRLENKLRNFRPDIAGITAFTHEIDRANAVAQVTRLFDQKPITVIGGVHATALPYQTLKEYPAFDFLIFGEGEETFQEFLATLRKEKTFEAIQGLGYRKNGRVCLGKPRPLIQELDQLPPPAWEFFPRYKTYHVLATRGCPFNCNFCMRVMGRQVRKRSPENVVAEITANIEIYNSRHLVFSDETFGIDKKYTHEILDLLIAKGLNTRMIWDAQSRVNVVDEDLLNKMKLAGCGTIGFGIESGSEQILRVSKKGITLSQAENAVKMAKKAGLKTGGFFIIGHPGETRETVKETIDFAAKLNTTTVAFGIMVPYPGTEIYEMARKGEGGYKILSTKWSDFNKTIGNSLELETLSRKDMEKLQLYAYFKFYIYNKRYLDFLRLFISQKRVVLAVLKKIFTKLK